MSLNSAHRQVWTNLIFDSQPTFSVLYFARTIFSTLQLILIAIWKQSTQSHTPPVYGRTIYFFRYDRYRYHSFNIFEMCDEERNMENVSQWYAIHDKSTHILSYGYHFIVRLLHSDIYHHRHYELHVNVCLSISFNMSVT